MTRTALTAALSAALIIPSVAFAGPREDVKFGYYAYELATPKGLKRVFARLENRIDAASRVRARQSISEREQADACKAELMEEILEKIDEPALTALWDAEDDVRLASD